MATPARAVRQRVPAVGGGATLRALEALFAPLATRDFAVRLWTGEVLPATAGVAPRFVLVLTHPASLLRMLWPPGELTVAEAFVRGDWDVEGDLVAAISLRDRLRLGPRDLLTLAPLVPALLRHAAPAAPRSGAARLRGRKHTLGRDADAVRHHYEAGNDFYALWLDARMVYSCAYFPEPTTTLDAAQEAKLELVCRKLRLAPGDRLLDVGCGWGGLVTWAAEHHGVTALGVTLSPAQAELARERIAARGLASRCRVEVADYRALRAEPFDKVVSVGMVEHVGVAQLPTYFRRAAELLRPGGLFLNHGIAPAVPRDDGLRARLFREGSFLQKYVFPDGELPFLHETAAAAVEAGLELRDVESLREHYALTLHSWLARLEARRAEAERVVGTTRYRVWRLYMAGAAADFERGQNTIYQAVYVKPEGGRSGLPLTRGGWYAEPRAAGQGSTPSSSSAASSSAGSRYT
ncbi:SAM-dependent methyltransferase [Anaeromyxobacter oryzae]|uniref:Cyclopropane-fatty-acyl-phospholipid synthase n=1 Tax=Anaeromyxobacter oryzae TaxID=2918170 RepID=A0ABN6MQB3_9BACT|nr:cyclopropane-fatty-acyl-phospholipid synthase family protein [Anaeromyxobacter oryzae]BDG03158.1 cyclopropane-fatty-acyl-phospholipid synthase [Anaeromyxobacter oryzae]